MLAPCVLCELRDLKFQSKREVLVHSICVLPDFKSRSLILFHILRFDMLTFGQVPMSVLSDDCTNQEVYMSLVEVSQTCTIEKFNIHRCHLIWISCRDVRKYYISKCGRVGLVHKVFGLNFPYPTHHNTVKFSGNPAHLLNVRNITSRSNRCGLLECPFQAYLLVVISDWLLHICISLELQRA